MIPKTLISSLSSVLGLVAQSFLSLGNPMDCNTPGSSVHGDSSGQNTGVGCLGLLQGIFLTPGSNPGLRHCRQILYHLSYQESPSSIQYQKIFCFSSCFVLFKKQISRELERGSALLKTIPSAFLIKATQVSFLPSLYICSSVCLFFHN